MKEVYFSFDGFPVYPPEDLMTLRMLESSRREGYIRKLSEEVVRTATFLIQRCRDVFDKIPTSLEIDQQHADRRTLLGFGKQVIEFLLIQKDLYLERIKTVIAQARESVYCDGDPSIIEVRYKLVFTLKGFNERFSELLQRATTFFLSFEKLSKSLQETSYDRTTEDNKLFDSRKTIFHAFISEAQCFLKIIRFEAFVQMGVIEELQEVIESRPNLECPDESLEVYRRRIRDIDDAVRRTTSYTAGMASAMNDSIRELKEPHKVDLQVLQDSNWLIAARSLADKLRVRQNEISSMKVELRSAVSNLE